MQEPVYTRQRNSRSAKRGNGEGSIYQDSRGLYRAAITLDNGKRKYLSGRTRAEVARKLTTALEAREQGTIVTEIGRAHV